MTSCTLDGYVYNYIPVYKGQPAYLGDGGPNPDFDIRGWRKAGRPSGIAPFDMEDTRLDP